MSTISADRHRPLSKRRFRILELVTAGRSNKEIAFELGVSEQRVKDLISEMLVQLDVPNRAGLADAMATFRILGHTRIAPAWRRFLFRDAPIGVAIVEGPEHRFVACNEAFRSGAGEDVVGRRFADVFPEHPACRARLDRVLSSGQRETGDVALQPLPGSDGRPAGVVIFATTPER